MAIISLCCFGCCAAAAFITDDRENTPRGTVVLRSKMAAEKVRYTIGDSIVFDVDARYKITGALGKGAYGM